MLVCLASISFSGRHVLGVDSGIVNTLSCFQEERSILCDAGNNQQRQSCAALGAIHSKGSTKTAAYLTTFEASASFLARRKDGAWPIAERYIFCYMMTHLSSGVQYECN